MAIQGEVQREAHWYSDCCRGWPNIHAGSASSATAAQTFQSGQGL